MVKIGVAQIANSASVEKNFSTIERFLKHFQKENVDLVVFPECGLSGFTAKMKECTPEVLEPYLTRVHEWVKDSGIEVMLPTAVFQNQKVYNSGFWFSS